jgi:16S rRNA (uracil1498-N3)-methyltransferase
MHRFYISPENWNLDAPLLTGAEAHHARDVLRMKPGDKAVLFNGRGRELTAEALEVGRAEIRFRKLHASETPPLRCRITLGQAIPKGKNMDLIVQKAVEIGAAEIAPLISERTIVDLDAQEAAQKQAKWQQVAIEAAKQCGQNWLPQVGTPRKLKDFFDGVAAANFNLRLIGSLQSNARPLKEVLSDYFNEHADRPTQVLILVGPEGDFTPAELGLARSHGCQPITLGPIILRVETAAIYCLSVLSYELL